MKILLKSTLITALCLVVLSGCGKDDAAPEDTASIGSLYTEVGLDYPDCPSLKDPVCTTSNKTYNNACHAEKAGETGWQPGACK